MTTFASLFRLPAAGKKFQLKFEVQIASDQTLSRVGRVFLFKNKYDMKKIVLFILLMLPVAVFGQKYTWFDKPGEVIDEPSFKVFQVLSSAEALVMGKGEGYSAYLGAIYLFVDPEGNFYDDQIIKAPRGMEVRRVGTVRYVTKNERTKTVPVIQIMEKQKKSKKKRKKE